MKQKKTQPHVHFFRHQQFSASIFAFRFQNDSWSGSSDLVLIEGENERAN
jgi:hypothetical protein